MFEYFQAVLTPRANQDVDFLSVSLALLSSHSTTYNRIVKGDNNKYPKNLTIFPTTVETLAGPEADAAVETLAGPEAAAAVETLAGPGAGNR